MIMKLRIDFLAATAVMLLGASAVSLAAQADSVTGAQKRAAAMYLSAVSSAGAAGLAGVLPQSELDGLRTELLRRIRTEEQRGNASLRKRLFGEASTLAGLERQTSQSFFVNLARRLELSARLIEDPEWLASIRDGDNRAIVLLRGRARDEDGAPKVTLLIEMMSDGKDWKPAIPGELRAQVDDLIRGRQVTRAASAAAAPAASTDEPAPTGERQANSPEIVAMLRTAEQVLVAGRCDRYYKDYMSPGFRKTQSDKALDTLIATCQRSLGTREVLISALRIVAKSTPSFEANGTRAVYDVADQGLPFDRFMLEQIDKRWYIAE
jgi:hypothetical protein